MKDFLTIIFSVAVSFFAVKSGLVQDLLTVVEGINFLTSFVAGIFFVSIFTAAPSVALFSEIFQHNSLLAVSIVGGLGALVGDFIIFRFVKDRLAEDILKLVSKKGRARFSVILENRFFHWFFFFIGALIVASPLPDELGLAVLGLAKMKNYAFIPLSFLLNALGILAIGLATRFIL